jgi:hypothetical protein
MRLGQSAVPEGRIAAHSPHTLQPCSAVTVLPHLAHNHNIPLGRVPNWSQAITINDHMF